MEVLPKGYRSNSLINLIEQAVVNLVDNAVKYSGPEKRVQVAGEQQNGETVIRVRDQGCGIGKEHFSRLFERFYRVDQARSRDLGAGSGHRQTHRPGP